MEEELITTPRNTQFQFDDEFILFLLDEKKDRGNQIFPNTLLAVRTGAYSCDTAAQ